MCWSHKLKHANKNDIISLAGHGLMQPLSILYRKSAVLAKIAEQFGFAVWFLLHIERGCAFWREKAIVTAAPAMSLMMNMDTIGAT